MTSKKNVPDAWDDDWVNQADTSSSTPADPTPTTSKKLSKSERRARQAEFNRKIWEEAEAENPTYFVASRGDVPLQSGFKPNVTLLSRKSTPTTGPISLAKKDPVSASAAGISGLSVQDDEDDEEEETGKPKVLTAEERALQAQREREEKQKRYDEARERLFGSSSASTGATTGTSPLRSNTPVRNGPVERGRGRGRGGVSSGGGVSMGGKEVKDARDGRDSRPGSSMSGRSKQLFEPGYAAKPDSIYLQRREAAEAGTGLPVEEQVIRAPKGPDGSGKGFLRKSADTET